MSDQPNLVVCSYCGRSHVASKLVQWSCSVCGAPLPQKTTKCNDGAEFHRERYDKHMQTLIGVKHMPMSRRKWLDRFVERLSRNLQREMEAEIKKRIILQRHGF